MASPYMAPAGTSTVRGRRRARNANPTPNIAPVIVWIISPNAAGPAEDQNLLPVIASVAERIIASGDPNSAEMWNSGVENP